MNATTRAFHGLIKLHRSTGICHACSMLLAFHKIEEQAGQKFESQQAFHDTCKSVASRWSWAVQETR